MNYFSKIKPVLNKPTVLNVYDSLYVAWAYTGPIDEHEADEIGGNAGGY